MGLIDIKNRCPICGGKCKALPKAKIDTKDNIIKAWFEIYCEEVDRVFCIYDCVPVGKGPASQRRYDAMKKILLATEYPDAHHHFTYGHWCDDKPPKLHFDLSKYA